LEKAVDGRLESDRHLWGFGGLHGGLALASLTARIQTMAPTGQMRSVSGRFHRAIRESFEIEATWPTGAGSITAYNARAIAGGETAVTAAALFGVDQAPVAPTLAPAAPVAPPPQECEVLTIPREFVPVAGQTEIRSIDTNRPFGGGSEARLTAWVRLVEDDRPPDLLRLIFLMDALAPSFSAVLTVPQPIPTIELSVYPTGGLPAHAPSPWVLLSARTDVATGSGWLSEHIDAWDLDGRHLATARQLRVVRAGNGQRARAGIEQPDPVQSRTKLT
jgi:hypothetical protein